MGLPKEIENKQLQLFDVCKKYNVTKLFVFGSASKGEFNSDVSDLDLMVELEDLSPIEKGENLMKLWSELEQIYGLKIDLLTEKKLKNPYLIREIENSKQLLYDRAS